MKKKVKRVAFDLDPELFEKLQETVKRKARKSQQLACLIMRKRSGPVPFHDQSLQSLPPRVLMLREIIRQLDRDFHACIIRLCPPHVLAFEDMKAWLLSWGTDRELPPPKCVCGKVHADESPRPRSRG